MFPYAPCIVLSVFYLTVATACSSYPYPNGTIVVHETFWHIIAPEIMAGNKIHVMNHSISINVDKLTKRFNGIDVFMNG